MIDSSNNTTTQGFQAQCPRHPAGISERQAQTTEQDDCNEAAIKDYFRPNFNKYTDAIEKSAPKNRDQKHDQQIETTTPYPTKMAAHQT